MEQLPYSTLVPGEVALYLTYQLSGDNWKIHTQTRGANKLWDAAQSDPNWILFVAVSVFTVEADSVRSWLVEDQEHVSAGVGPSYLTLLTLRINNKFCVSPASVICKIFILIIMFNTSNATLALV